MRNQQPSLVVKELIQQGGTWQSMFEDAIPYQNGADRSWSMGFIDDGQPELDILISQINSDEEKTNHAGEWPVWSVDTRYGQ